MMRRSLFTWCAVAGMLTGMPSSFAHPSPQSAAENHAMASDLRLQSRDVSAQGVVMLDAASQKEVKVAQHGKFGVWTLMAVLREPDGGAAVFENVEDRKGSIVYVNQQGVILTLAKSLEPTSVAQNSLYRGRTMDEIGKTRADVLGAELLTGNGDPSYADVAAALPPLRVPTFVGTRHSDEKPTYDYGGFSDEIYVDAGKIFTEIQDARNKHDVWEGLVGGWLPVVRFVFPASEQRYWEETIFADEEPGHFWTQPVWYRVLLVDGGQLKEAHYFYHHLPFPPLGGINVFGGYGYNNVDTFQDTLNADVTAFLEWGLFDIAGRYIDDYFTNSVRADGSIDTRGPEIGQYGKMLEVVARYYSYAKDDALLRKHQEKLQAIVDLFYSLRKESKQVPAGDISYGIVRGWSEHDSSLKVHPYRFMQPHFSNNAEAARGFHDLGLVWIEMGRKHSNEALELRGRRMLQESEDMKKDLNVALEKSVDRKQTPAYLPAVAGDVPTYGKQRVYSEMLDSGELTEEQADIIVKNLAANGGSMFGLLRYGVNIDGFLDFGPAYARLQFDWVREFLLLYYAHMAHIYSPGTWTSVESSKIDGTLGGPYCTPAQVTIPTLTKWMLVFAEPDNSVLWLARATPREWLEQGNKIAVTAAPTRFGKMSYELRSDVQRNKVSAVIDVPEGSAATIKLRCRVPGGKKIRSVAINGEKWTDFSAEQEVVTIPPRLKGEITVEISY